MQLLTNVIHWLNIKLTFTRMEFLLRKKKQNNYSNLIVEIYYLISVIDK